MSGDLDLRIRKLELRDGDTLVLTWNKPLPASTRANLQSKIDMMVKRLGVKVATMVLDTNAELTVVRKQPDHEASASAPTTPPPARMEALRAAEA